MRHRRESFFTIVLAIALLSCASRTAAQTAPSPVQPTTQTYRSIAALPLHAYVFTPPQHVPSMPAILLFHGGGWTAGKAEWLFDTARRFALAGFVAIPIEYRLASDSVTPIEQYDDACAAFQWVRQQALTLGVDPKHVAGYGVSAGGQMVGLLATRGCTTAANTTPHGGPDAMLLLSPALDLATDPDFAQLLHGRGTAAELSPITMQRARVVPTFIVHGAADSLTPVPGVRQFCATQRAYGGRCVLKIYSGVGHLLTRDLAHQETVLDPDPAMREEGLSLQQKFLRALWARPTAGAKR
jgi:acetyl esterase